MSMWDESTGELIEYGAQGAQLAHEPQTTVGLIRAGSDGGTLGMLVQAAQGIQRDPAKMIATAKQIGGLLGSDGFYRFPMGGENIEGPSIDLAEALAQAWRGIVYQVRIVHAESLASGGQRVHLRASVADMCSLVCAEVDQVISTAPPPGKFANKADQRERWHAMQLQSASSKIVRNAILRVLPSWYVEPAFEEAKRQDSEKTLKGMTLEKARAGALESLKKFGCSQQELEIYLGHPIDMWAVPQLSALRDLYKSLNSGAQSVEAWRAELTHKSDAATAAAPKRSALGLSAESASKPVDVPKPAETAPIANTAQSEPVQAQQAEEPSNNVSDLVEKHKTKRTRQPGEEG